MLGEHGMTWAEIDLGALRDNVRLVRRRLGQGTALAAVVKANGYGHGAVAVARAAVAAGAEWLAVSRVEEGVELRAAGLTSPILLLGYAPPAQAPVIVSRGLTPAVASKPVAEALAAAAAAQGQTVQVHLKVDTGMGRFGVLPSEAVDFARLLLRLQPLRIEGVFSHFASADEPQSGFTAVQHRVFTEVISALAAAGITVPLKHIANSAGALLHPYTHHDLVRLGIAMYGLPSAPEEPWPLPLRPVMSLKTTITRVRTLPAGATVGYGRTFVAPAPTPVALVGVGYGDGYQRRCSQRGGMLVHGQRAPLAGRVSMDQCSLDISGIDGVAEGDEVVVFGRQGDAEITVAEVAQWAGTITHEVVTPIAARVPRVYL
jgi:alanine racemase